jgi:hypothetical protein
MRPPTRGSNTRSAIGTGSRLYSGGNQLPIPSVNTVNARSIGASTTIDDRTAVRAVFVLIFPSSLRKWLPTVSLG